MKKKTYRLLHILELYIGLMESVYKRGRFTQDQNERTTSKEQNYPYKNASQQSIDPLLLQGRTVEQDIQSKMGKVNGKTAYNKL